MNTTSYAILGLLNLRPYTAYELAAQSGRSLRYLWPKAQSRLYEEPKRLAREGLIEIVTEPAGPIRRRKVYRIRPKGRQQLQEWLKTEPAAPRLEFETLLRVFLADAGTSADLRATLAATRRAAEDEYEQGKALIDQYAAGDIAFEERLHLNMLWTVFTRDLLWLIIDWCEFAEQETREWSSTKGTISNERSREILAALSSERRVLRQHYETQTPTK